MKDQHESILEAITVVHRLLDEQSATPILVDAITQIHDLSRLHVREEEDVLRGSTSLTTIGISSFDAHQALHRSFLDQILKMRQQAERFDRKSLSQKLTNLDDWLKTHIANETLAPSRLKIDAIGADDAGTSPSAPWSIVTRDLAVGSKQWGANRRF